MNEAGTEVTGTAEPDSVVEIDVDGDGIPDYSTTADGNGDYVIDTSADPLVNGETITATATDAANNTSDPTTIVVPVKIDAIDDVDTAEIIVGAVTTTETLNDSDTSILNIFGVNNARPSVDFTIGEGNTGSAVIDVSAGGLVGLLDKTSLVLQVKDVNGNYVDVGNSSSGGLIDVIGILGQSARFEIDNLPAGEYRINGKVSGVIGLVTTATINAVITETDPSAVGPITTVDATGNVIDENDVATDNTVVTEVNGQPVNATGTTTIPGDHGTLVIDATGAYTYTPNSNVGEIGQMDEFEYTIVDTVTNSTDSATLTVGIESDYPAVNFPIDAVNDVATTQLIVNPLVIEDTIDKSGFSAVFFPARFTEEFTVDPGNTATASISVGSAGVLTSNEIIVEKQNPNGSWSQVAGGDSSSGGGLLNIGGLLGSRSVLNLEDLTAGTYRIKAEGGGVVAAISLDAVITQTDPDAPGTYGSEAAVGNVITANDDATPSTRVSDVDGTAVNGTTVIDGDYGTLTIKPDGSYFYTPDGDVTVIGQTEEFEYTIIDDFNNTDTATITINITSDWPAPAPLAARMMLDDSFTLADDADDADAIDLPETSLSVSDEGLDVLSFDGADQVISLADIMEPEMIDISGTGANTLNVAAEDVNSAIYVQGDSDDTVDLAGDNWSTVEQTTSGGEVYDVWQSGNDAMTQIYIDPNVNII